MKLEAGKYYRTRDGSKAKVLCIDAPDMVFPCIGYVLGQGVAHTWEWSTEGTCSVDAAGPSDFEIVSEWREPVKVEGWVNVFSDGSFNTIRRTREQADAASAGRKDRIACVYVTGTEGIE